MPDAGMRGRVCVITGATSGIGRVTALELARTGASVVMVGRDPRKTEATAGAIRSVTGNDAVMVALADLASLRAVRGLAADLLGRHERIDVLVNNAGAVYAERALTGDGIERTFAVNHLAHFLLTDLLLPSLRRAGADGGARVVNVSSSAHHAVPYERDNLQGERRYRPLRAYATSKLANILFTYELARRLAGTGITANTLHPGFTRTRFGHGDARTLDVLFTLLRPFMIDAERGAETPVYLSSSPDVAATTGKYFVKCRPRRSSSASYDAGAARDLWAVSEALVRRA